MDITVTYQNVTSGNVVSDLLLSGNADIGIGGNVPVLQPVGQDERRPKGSKGIMAFSQANMFLITVDPHISSIRDYGDKDRIAMTDVKGTTYSMLLQMFAAKEFGWDSDEKLDNLAVGMGNNDAMISLTKGAGEVKSHMTILPHSVMELASGKARIILNSKDLLGTAYTTVAAFTTQKFHDENPKLYEAVVAGLQDAIDYIKTNTEAARRSLHEKGALHRYARRSAQDDERTDADELSFTSYRIQQKPSWISCSRAARFARRRTAGRMSGSRNVWDLTQQELKKIALGASTAP